MLINHPTDGATRGLTLRVRLLGLIYKKNGGGGGQKICYADCSLIRWNTVCLVPNLEFIFNIVLVGKHSILDHLCLL